MSYLRGLQQNWVRPDATVPRVARGPSGTWVDREASVSPDASILGKIWVGAGRKLPDDEMAVGPAILWDDPTAIPSNDSVPWQELEPTAATAELAVRRTKAGRVGKRLFDIVFSLVVLTFTLPLYPIIALAIMIEDGWPIFFAHRRETLGGREFPCLKFRSMRRDADEIKAQLQAENVSDGPQFFVKNDPRSTRVGKWAPRDPRWMSYLSSGTSSPDTCRWSGHARARARRTSSAQHGGKRA